ncbi:hypothetical protein N8I74_06440 [Chitiniphilus purpureus]|uniref:Uncharacterized protein n=1 Tax=Chitiniphilus purpureus TaxID=2981137 RepID=A0ABY6DQM2_9NEIS|nr:hypothetical protein [Chitiniphilus sp. CD1]UXY16654.1 hypothetical protein N8I74_06440 [Chitiniphilus sp. CD1]
MQAFYLQKQPNRNNFITNPKTQTPIFGVFPAIQKHDFPQGNIYLRHGEHKSRHKGFGLIHIWAERFPHLTEIADAESKVLPWVGSILGGPADIHCEFDDPRGEHRPTILRGRYGLLIVEFRKDGENGPFYSIVTAYVGQAKGPKIGAFKVSSS